MAPGSRCHYDLELWEDYGVDNPWSFPFTSLGDPVDDPPAVIDLGETYDYADATIPANCGDVRTTIIAEYVSDGTPYFPGCTEFSQSLTDPNFSFSQLKSRNYTWAILRSYFT
jgi:hypothetical protein